jgi:hypothetical protein
VNVRNGELQAPYRTRSEGPESTTVVRSSRKKGSILTQRIQMNVYKPVFIISGLIVLAGTICAALYLRTGLLETGRRPGIDVL